MALTKEQAISQYGTESYTGWGETEAAADAKAKGISAGSGSSVSGLNSTGDVSNYLDSTQQQLYSSIQQQLGEIPTEEEVIGAIQPDQERPDLISRTQILEEQKTKYGVTDLETELTNINTDINTINATLRETKAAEEGKPVALGVMAGRMTEEERQAATKMDYLNVRKQTLVDQISTAYTAINMYVTYAGQDYQDAVTSYNTEFEQNLSIQNTLSSLRSERLGATKDVLDVYSTAKQQAINNAQANLTTITNAISKGNMKYDSLSADEKLNIQKLEIQSGLPVGTVSNLQLAPSDKILGWSDDKTQAMITDENGNFKVISTGLKASSNSTSDSKTSSASFKNDASLSVAMNFPDLVEKYASIMSLEEIYKAYLNSEMGKEYGTPTEDKKVMQLVYKVARGEMTEEEALLEL